MRYKKYIGCFVKRFYTPFEEQNIFKIKDYRDSEMFPDGEFLYSNGKDEWWSDIEDSVIITNELPIIDDERIANVNDKEYNGFNPFKL